MSSRILAALFLLALAPGASALTQQETDALVKRVDERQHNNGDWAASCYMESKEKDKTDVVYDLLYFRRTEGQRLLILFTRPKDQTGKGYLRIEKNLWSYDPSTGRWERRTERERIGGSDTRRGDLDVSRLAEEYTARWEGSERLGKFDTHRLQLDVKEGIDVAFPRIRLWVDAATGNILKRQEMALSGRLMRTSYYPRWRKVHSESKGADVWYPEEMRYFDEIDKTNSTLILVRRVDLRPLDQNVFTKAWLESKSR